MASRTKKAFEGAHEVERYFQIDRQRAEELSRLPAGALNKREVGWAMTYLHNASVTNRVFKNWEKEGRQALAMHPELVREVVKARSGKIPLEVLFALPYINPMIVFTDPPVFELPGGTQIKMHGFICFGKSKNEVVNTHDEGVTDIAGVFVTEIVGLRNDPDDDLDYPRISFPVQTEPRSMAQHVQTLVDGFYWQTQGPNEGDASYIKGADQKRYLKWLAQHFIGVVLYLCSATMDIEIVPAPRPKRGQRKPVQRSPIVLRKVGWNIGPALYKQRKLYYEYPDSVRGTGSGQPQLPQHRICHFKTTWNGPNRSIPKLTFVAPYWTHREQLGERGTNTMHEVPKK